MSQKPSSLQPMQPWPDWIGIAGAFVPLHHRAGVVGDRPLAAHLVKAISLARVLVVPRLDKQAGIVVGAAIAGVVNAAAVELLGPAVVVERRNLAQHQQVRHDAIITSAIGGQPGTLITGLSTSL